MGPGQHARGQLLGGSQDAHRHGEIDLYGPNWDRLVETKRRYDPANIFHLNQNISPADSLA